ncbi:hypothetical protein EVAR_63288_1 [Eumeta japonica]|uniref:Uncharacterized protein n=1 Tax=Eumeta variegata TaxID=151549 RepID=A0A4C1ZZB4_EUMVA|nr:hypothetical protein EVAR_63288_1 [Eumeta japonica]
MVSLDYRKKLTKEVLCGRDEVWSRQQQHENPPADRFRAAHDAIRCQEYSDSVAPRDKYVSRKQFMNISFNWNVPLTHSKLNPRGDILLKPVMLEETQRYEKLPEGSLKFKQISNGFVASNPALDHRTTNAQYAHRFI